MKARVYVTLKPSVFDPQGRVVADALVAGAPIAAPCYRQQRGHPVGFAAGMREELENLHGDQGARSVLQRHRQAMRLLEVDDPGILADIDTPRDLP